MADFAAIADAIAARFLGTTPPTGQPAIRAVYGSELPNAITVTPCLLVFEPDDEWEAGMSSRRGTMTFGCYLVLAQSDQPRTTKAMLDWRTALLSRLDGQVHLGGVAGVAQAVVTKTGSGKLTYSEQEWAGVSLTVVASIVEAMTAVA
jgi:hypothetical protein